MHIHISPFGLPNKIGSFVKTWMDLESGIQSKVSQKEKNRCHIVTYIWKKGTDDLICFTIVLIEIYNSHLAWFLYHLV